MNTDTVIRLNVGGRHFETLHSTLCVHNSPLKHMFDAQGAFNGQCPVDADGRVFLDRDGDAFAVVLAYLRTGRAVAPDGVSPDRCNCEFEYFLGSARVRVLGERAMRVAKHPIIGPWLKTIVIHLYRLDPSVPIQHQDCDMDDYGRFIPCTREIGPDGVVESSILVCDSRSNPREFSYLYGECRATSITCLLLGELMRFDDDTIVEYCEHVLSVNAIGDSTVSVHRFTSTTELNGQTIKVNSMAIVVYKHPEQSENKRRRHRRVGE